MDEMCLIFHDAKLHSNAVGMGLTVNTGSQKCCTSMGIMALLSVFKCDGCSIRKEEIWPHSIGSRSLFMLTILHRLYALLWPSNIYVVPAGMSACQICSTQFAARRPIQKSTAASSNWPVLKERGHEPLQLCCFSNLRSR